MKKTRKLAALLLIIMLIFVVLLAACTKTDDAKPETTADSKESEEKKETKEEEEAEKLKEEDVEIGTFIYFIPGQKKTDEDAVITLVNEQLLASGLNFELEILYASWGEWEAEINLKLSSADAFDMFNIMNDLIHFSTYLGRNALIPITEDFDKYGSALKEAIPESIMAGCYFQGELYGIGQYGWNNFAELETITIRKDLWEKYGLDSPITLDDLFEDTMTIYEGEDNPDLIVQGRNMLTISQESFNRTYAEYPFAVMQEIFMIKQDGTVSAWFESDEFEQNCREWRRYYDAGLIDPDWLSWEGEVQLQNLNSGRAIFDTSNTLHQWEILAENVPGATLENILLEPTKSHIDYVGARHINAVPFSSENPQYGIQFFNWLFENDENHDLFVYGLEDRNWEVSDATLTWDGVTVPTMNIIGIEEGMEEFLYGRSFWRVGNMAFKNYAASEHPQNIFMDNVSNVTKSPIVGFVFDSAPVVNEFSNVGSQLKSVMWPIKLGLQDYDEYYEQALEVLKAAGLDKLIVEYQSQLDAFLAK